MKRTTLLAVACLATLLGPTVVVAARAPVDVDPAHVKFGRQTFESETKRTFIVTNVSDENVVVSIEQVRVGDDFSPGQIESTCPLTDAVTLAPGESCEHVIGFRPTPFFGGRETALMRVVVRDTEGNLIFEQDVRLSGHGF